MDVDAYLRRIDYSGARTATLDTLRAVNLAHLRTIPFENSSVLRGEPIVLEPSRLIAKLVEHRRGGFCYELNGAFAELLRGLGFAVELMPGRFWSDRGLGPPFEHLCLRVTLSDEPWLVDVGAGYSFVEPLRLATGVEQTDSSGRFRIVTPADDAGQLEVEWLHRDATWRPHYRFEPRPAELVEFAATCEWLRTASDSPFTQGWMCARALADGYASLQGRRLVVSSEGARDERILDDDTELASAVARWFDVGPAPRSLDLRMKEV